MSFVIANFERSLLHVIHTFLYILCVIDFPDFSSFHIFFLLLKRKKGRRNGNICKPALPKRGAKRKNAAHTPHTHSVDWIDYLI